MTAAPIIRIVDDDPNIHDALAYVLENEGFIVRHYESAESFLINDRPEDPGCAILDVRMGEMSGIVLHDRMKKLGSKLPCIFFQRMATSTWRWMPLKPAPSLFSLSPCGRKNCSLQLSGP